MQCIAVSILYTLCGYHWGRAGLVHFIQLETRPTSSYSESIINFYSMDAREHLYKVLVIGEYGVGKSFYDPLFFYWCLLIVCFVVLLPGKVSMGTGHRVTSLWGFPLSLYCILVVNVGCLYFEWKIFFLFFFCPSKTSIIRRYTEGKLRRGQG